MSSIGQEVLLASVPVGGHSGVVENMVFQVVGLAVVLVSLGALACGVALIGSFMARASKKPKADSAPAPSAPTSPHAQGVPPEVVAVIAAAIHATIRRPHRIVRIHPPANPWLQAWSIEGRRQIFQSHRVR